jgi:hypothetical protein
MTRPLHEALEPDELAAELVCGVPAGPTCEECGAPLRRWTPQGAMLFCADCFYDRLDSWRDESWDGRGRLVRGGG